MKKLMCAGLLWMCCIAVQAQTPESSKTNRKPLTYGTDSVRGGNQTFQGGSGKSQGDTLAKPRNSLKQAGPKSKSVK